MKRFVLGIGEKQYIPALLGQEDGDRVARGYVRLTRSKGQPWFHGDVLEPHGSHLPENCLHSSVWELYTDIDTKSGDHEIDRPLRCGAS